MGDVTDACEDVVDSAFSIRSLLSRSSLRSSPAAATAVAGLDDGGLLLSAVTNNTKILCKRVQLYVSHT